MNAAKIATLMAMAAISLPGCDNGSGPDPIADLDNRMRTQRERMVVEQLQTPPRRIQNPRVLQAMRQVPRQVFVPEDQRAHAYDDTPLPIGHNQTISQPYVVAFMTEQLNPQPEDRVLEIGTGSGYQAAVLASLVKAVYSVEIIEPLGRQAEHSLRQLGITNVYVKIGDGYAGWPEHAPFDAIIVTCAPEDVPQPLIDQLKDGGRMIIPAGPVHHQELYLLEKRGSQIRRQAVLPVRFVPMTGQAAEDREQDKQN